MPKGIHKLTVKGNLLRLNGKRRTIALAEHHNRRTFDPRFNDLISRINRSRSHLNGELITLGGKSLEEIVMTEIRLAGVDMMHRTNKRKDKGLANEYIFSLTPGFDGEVRPIFEDCLIWLKMQIPTCPIVHAVIHLDENQPHMHVIVVPIVGDRLPASDLIWYGEKRILKEISLYEEVSRKYGLYFPNQLRGDAKKKLAEVVLQAFNTLTPDDKERYLYDHMLYAIRANPEDYVAALGINVSQVLGLGSPITKNVTLPCVSYVGSSVLSGQKARLNDAEFMDSNRIQ